MPPDTKPSKFDPDSKLSQFRSPHKKKQGNSDPYTEINSDPHIKIKSFSTTHNNRINFDTNTVIMSFSSVSFCALYIQVHVPVMQQQYVLHKNDDQLA